MQKDHPAGVLREISQGLTEIRQQKEQSRMQGCPSLLISDNSTTDGISYKDRRFILSHGFGPR
jgi:hypothetical protein